MKLHLLILASLFHLSSGYMTELTGPLAAGAECSGAEYADFKACAVQGFAEEAGEDVSGGEDEAFINHGVRGLQWNICSGCTGGAPVGSFCFTVCGGRRRLAEKRGLRRLESEATFVNGTLTSGEEGTDAANIGNSILVCFQSESADHPCLPSTDEMTLKVIAS
jgi:hypothetical protein